MAFARIIEIIRTLLGAAGNSGTLIALIPRVFNVLTNLPERGDIRGQHNAAVEVLAIIAPQTETKIDDGAVIALRVLGRDDEWIAFVEGLLEGSAPVATDDDGLVSIPDGAMALSVDAENHIMNTMPTSAKMVAGGMQLASLTQLAQLLPVIIQLISTIRDLRD